MAKDGTYFVGVDVGGTKIHAALVERNGRLLSRYRTATPVGASAQENLVAITGAIRTLLDESDLDKADLAGLGLAVPGVVDYQNDCIVTAPNIAISGVNLVAPLAKAFGCPVQLGNDVDAGTLGEQWVGVARGVQTAVGIFPGTGVGGGIIINGKLLRGRRYSTAELGHLIIERGGHRCGCGNQGCVEAIASRTAIERDLRAAMAAGEPTVLHELLDDGSERIKSGVLADALQRDDELVRGVLSHAAEALGVACVTIRHTLDPELFVFGGGIIEACGEFLLPIVDHIVRTNPYLGDREGGVVLASVLADDAGVIGAAALGMEAAGLDPLEDRGKQKLTYPRVEIGKDGNVTIGKKTYADDCLLRVTGNAKRRRKKEPNLRSPAQLTRRDVGKACKGGPARLVIASSCPDEPLSEDVQSFLRWRGIEVESLRQDAAVKTFEACPARKALLVLRGE